MKEFLQELFQNPYRREGWRGALETMLPNAKLLTIPKKLDEDDHYEGYELGYLLTPDGYDIGLFEYEIKGGGRIAKNRTGLRKLISTYLKYDVDAALVVYHDREQWRLSFVCDLKDEKTAPKRFSYVFGDPDQSYRTPLERFETLTAEGATFANLYEAFSVDRLDADFFKGYKDLYGVFCKYAPDTRQYRNYVKKMMGRLVFLWFLQKKGWLGGDRNYMANLLARSKERYRDTFLSEVLGVLFFDTLNEKREGDAVHPILGGGVRIPYLNGGLFERDALDEQGVDFPFECFEWLFDFFALYNFTVDENDPNDAEIGVDPEMLGHIFENLLEDNKDKGAYYTPKEVVQYMCRDSLAQYLKANAPNVDEWDIDKLVNDREVYWMTLTDDDTKRIIELLRNVRVCDPSIGSGAFPMGMLNELYNIRYAIYEHFGQTDKITPYILKRDIVRNNIYGVDLDQGAVDIARLRFWLALVVDDTERRPLPNLDYKIMQGNSLLESFMGIDFSIFFEKEGRELHAPTAGKQALVAEYFGESDHGRKFELRKCIDDRVSEHIGDWCMARPAYAKAIAEIDPTDKPFFLWNVYFNHIVGSGGFDIVIGNPPYGASTSEQDKRQYKREYRTTRTLRGRHQQKGSQDTYSIFIEQGYNVLRENGILSFIVPISVTSSDSMVGVHKLLLNNCREIKMSSYASTPKPVFENAVVSVSIMSFLKTKSPCEAVYMTKTNRRKSNVSLSSLLKGQRFIEAGDYILKGRFPKVSEKIEKDILSKLFAIPVNLGKFIQQRGEPLYYRTGGGSYFLAVTNYPTGSTKERPIYVNSHIRNLVGAILSTSLFHWHFQIYSNFRDVKSFDIESFAFPVDSFDDELIEKISDIYKEYLADIEANMRVLETKAYKNIDRFKQYKIGKSKHFIDRLDDLICPVYGLSPEETEFIKNYEIEFRVPDAKTSKNVE